MNKFQKSLDRIKKNLSLHEDSWTDEDKEHILTIMEALEKQIPKKLIDGGLVRACPVCESGINEDYGQPKYCDKCGQKLL